MSFKTNRKLVRQGANNSLTVVLPKIWVEHNNLKKGDTVEIEFDPSDSLTVRKGSPN